MSQCLPPYFYAIFAPISVRVSEYLATAYQPLFGSLYLVHHFHRMKCWRGSRSEDERHIGNSGLGC